MTREEVEAEQESTGEARSDATERCQLCFGTDGHHIVTCPNLNADDARNEEELPPPALEQNESGDELPGKLDEPQSKSQERRHAAQAVGGKPLSQEEIQSHFDKADKLFEGKKFEDGAVVEEEEPPTPEEQLSRVKLPPSAQMMVGNELLWLVARTCHEVNRAYCVGVMSDHSHQPWDQAPDWQRESCYEGVLKHYHNPRFTPEDSHKSWMAKKIEDGWVHGNMKDETAKTHPNIVPYHTLHIHERTKDALFSAICKSMLGGKR